MCGIKIDTLLCLITHQLQSFSGGLLLRFFLTSSAEFAVESYVVGAYFYQLKPIWEDSFFRLTDSVIAECRRADQRSLILRCKTGISRIDLDQLLYCEVLGRTAGCH